MLLIFSRSSIDYSNYTEFAESEDFEIYRDFQLQLQDLATACYGLLDQIYNTPCKLR